MLYVSVYYNSFIFLSITFYSDSCFILSAFLQQLCAYSLFHLIIPYSSCFAYRCSSDSTELVIGLADHRIRVRFLKGTDFSKRFDLMVCDAVSLGVQFPTLRRNLVLNREGYSSRSRVLDPEEGSTLLLPNIMNDSPNNTATQLGYLAQICLLSTESIEGLWTVEPYIQFVFPGVKRPVVKLNTHLYLLAEAQKECVVLYHHEKTKARSWLQMSAVPVYLCVYSFPPLQLFLNPVYY